MSVFTTIYLYNAWRWRAWSIYSKTAVLKRLLQIERGSILFQIDVDRVILLPVEGERFAPNTEWQGFFILLIVGRTKPFCCQFVRTGFNISPSWKGQSFYCSLLQRTWILLFPFVESRVFITPCCRRQGSFLFPFCRGQGFYCSLLQRTGFLLLPVAEDKVLFPLL
jgi:hypothetical protein